ncbi:MAG: two-component system, OmpR family, sensor histidine kinase KdpD, partial [Nocardioidaceae bacterium]|nr:two-component system, OmpR family, sensor histidine kinase KdpD [Nocardioidaceae bacterium]
TGNLTALRELALIWLADKVDDELDSYREQHDISATWETRERVVVALTGGPEGETLIRRAARLAARAKGADLMAVHVSRNDGLAGGSPVDLARQRTLVESLGGSYHQVVGPDISSALLDFARGVNATELVLGVSRRGRLSQVLSRGVGATVTQLSGPIDVHLVTHEAVPHNRPRERSASALSRSRRLTGLGLAVLGLPLLTLALTHLREDFSLASDLLLMLGGVVVVALAGGLYPALFAAVTGSLLLNYYFTPPTHRFTIANHDDVLALAVFLAVAVAVSATVDRAARRTREAARARTEAEALSALAGSVVRGARPLPALLDQLRETLGFTSVTLLERVQDTPPGPDVYRDASCWRIAAAVGDRPSPVPADGDAEVLVDDQLSLVLRGHPLAAEDRRLTEAFAAQAAAALNQQRLAEQAAAAGPLAEVDKMRTALLSAVSHDLRTPLASAKAAANGLRSEGVVFSDGDRDELLATIEESLDRLTRLVENLLDMSRLQAGALATSPQPMSMSETIATALDELGEDGRDIVVHVPEDLPEVYADPVLVERILVNTARNAVRYSPEGTPAMIAVSEHAGTVETRIVDRGPGIPSTQWQTVFLPFQRLGDRDNATGVGLGLALSRGLAEAMKGSLTPDTTPGGGLTITLRLPCVPPAAPSAEPLAEAVADSGSGPSA